jgi:phage recombination protein Bet
MTATNEATAAALAIRDGQDFWDAKQLAALAQLGIKDASNADLAVFMHYCQKTGLDPFSRQIYMIGRRVKDGGEWKVRQTIQVGIDGYRVIAQRAARRDGVTLAYGDTTWYDDDGTPYPVWVLAKPPAAAAVTVYRDGKPFPGVARFGAFAATNKEGDLIGLWATMGDHQIAKCAEAQALRKAFPHDLVGIHTDDETASTSHRPPAKLTVAQVTGPGPDPGWRRERTERQESPPPDPAKLKADVRVELERLGIVDPEECDEILRNLTAEDDLTKLTGDDLAKVLTTLVSCDQVGELYEITGQAT